MDYIKSKTIFGPTNFFFQILWKSRCNFLVTFPSRLKTFHSMRFWIEKFNCRLLFEKVVVHCLHHRNFFVPGPIKYYFENVKVLSLSEPGSEVDCRLNRYCCESRGLEKETFVADTSSLLHFGVHSSK